MKKQSILTLVTISLMFNFGLTKIEGTIIYDDGQIHDITWLLDDDVLVKDSINEESTTLRLLPIGAVNGSVEAFNSSEVFIDGGYIYHYLRAYDSSQVTMSAGYVGMQFFAENHSDVTLTGGLIDDILTIQGNSTVTISGGEISQWITTNNTSNLTVSGGLFAGSSHDFYVGSQSVVTFIGSDFTIDGNSVAYGQYFASDFAGGTLTGTLTNGDMLNSGFNIYDNASIVLTPEPSTLLLLGFGAVMMRKRS